MTNFSDCNIAKVKCFLGLKSIDPLVPFNEFVEKNLKDLKALIEKNRIIVIDGYGNEVNSSDWKHHIINFYEKVNAKINFAEDHARYENNDDEKYDFEEEDQEEFELLLNELNAEEEYKTAHKKKLVKALEECETPHRKIIENGIKNTDQKIEELQNELKSLNLRLKKQKEQ